ncbi:MAG TPA: ATP-binding protein [Candidatus Polarisedimenticolaceae bacterium]|nr:ATP-binding protein [Candidatus Polarisedimenticolaceae bacterium]
MRVPLSLRIFVLNAAFTVGVGALAFVMVRESFQTYYRSWEQSLATRPAEQLFEGTANEIARALLLRLEREPEVKDRDGDRIVMGLNAILREIPSIRSFLVVDRDKRIQYANDPSVVDLAFTGPERSSLFASDQVVRQLIEKPQGGAFTRVMVPVFDDPPNATGPRRRLGSLLLDFEPDNALLQRLPRLQPPSVSATDSMRPLFIFLLVGVASGLLMAAITAVPVRRLDRALTKFRAGGFRGRLDAERLGLGSGLESAVSAINEMGGRLEALDSRGREREALLATLSQSLEEGMLAIDERGRPVAWNAAALRILGVPAEGADDAAIKDALARHPELAIGWSAGSVHPARGVEIVRDGGEPTPVQVTEVPFEPRPGASGTLVLLRDLGTLQKVEAHLLEAGRFAVLAHLAGSLAHEIRNPLHSIGLNAGVVQQYVGEATALPSRRAMSESLHTIQEETRRLTELLNNYLGLLRSAPEPAEVDVRDTCKRVMQLLSYAAMKARVDLRLESDGELPPVFGVPDRLQQAVLNLVLNAIQAMPQGGRVVLHVGASGGLVRVSVTDSGPGLPQELAEKLFDTRVTTKPGGSGLGLPLVRMIAEAHGGSVWYRSDAGQGATFTLVLPSAREAA